VIVPLDERDHFACHELDVLAAEWPPRVRIAVVFDRQVLARTPHFPVVEADDQQRRDPALSHQPRDRFGDPPGVAGERARRVEEILPVVQIQDRNGRRAVTR
jgi:hypothetical protein